MTRLLVNDSKLIIRGFICLVVIQVGIFYSIHKHVPNELPNRKITCLLNPSHIDCMKIEDRRDEELIDKNTDRNLHPMEFDIGDGEQTFMAYIAPDVSSFYQQEAGTRDAQVPNFKGLAGKFINLSPEPLRLYWKPYMNAANGHHIADNPPFEATGTATFDGHLFFFASTNDISDVKINFHVKSGQSIYVYDPYDPVFIGDGEILRDLSELNQQQLSQYNLQKKNILFGNKYKEFTGRDWLSLFPSREPPTHFMWDAEYFGQQHIVETYETYFITEPSKHLLSTVKNDGVQQQKALKKYRDPNEILSLTLTVLSCAPRAFEIKNFLSDVEVDHIMEIATGAKLHVSTVSGSDGGGGHTDNTRTSFNTWMARNKSPIFDSVYRRAADVMNIDEALLRRRSGNERPDLDFTSSIAEDLQLVHYSVGQQYTAHHDFGHPSTSKHKQPSRFATLLLYLNEEGVEGGHTSFPRYLNAESRGELHIKPEKGKAVLFYSMLPDGNMDDLSQHASKPVHDGEKWLMNLWVWDPVR